MAMMVISWIAISAFRRPACALGVPTRRDGDAHRGSALEVVTIAGKTRRGRRVRVDSPRLALHERRLARDAR
jgi:hypothetical protein